MNIYYFCCKMFNQKKIIIMTTKASGSITSPKRCFWEPAK